MMKNVLTITTVICALSMLSGCGDKCSCCKCDKAATECPCTSCTCEQQAPAVEQQPATQPEAPKTETPAEQK